MLFVRACENAKADVDVRNLQNHTGSLRQHSSDNDESSNSLQFNGKVTVSGSIALIDAR